MTSAYFWGKMSLQLCDFMVIPYLYIFMELGNWLHIITLPKIWNLENYCYFYQWFHFKKPVTKFFMIAQHLPNQTRVVTLIIQTKPFPLTRPNTKPYLGERIVDFAFQIHIINTNQIPNHTLGGQRIADFAFGFFLSSHINKRMETSEKSARREVFNYNRKFKWVSKDTFVGLISYPYQGTTFEHQDEVGEPSVWVRLLPQLPPHLRGQRHGEGQPERERLPHRWKVSLSIIPLCFKHNILRSKKFLRTLCCGEGSLKDQFAKGEINFQPERMSFIR